MPITHVITHHINLQSPDTEATTDRRDTELPLEGPLEELLRDLKRTFCNRTGKAYGEFSEDTGTYPLASLLRNYCEERIDFATLSRDALAHFKVELEKAGAITDSHLFMWEETFGDARYLYLSVVDHDEALYIDGELNVSITPNIGSPLLTARVKLTEWLDGSTHYLSVLRLRAEQELRDAFWGLVGFDDRQLDLVGNTGEFLEVVNAYSQTLPQEKAQETRAQVVEYCLEQDQSGEPVVFEELSKALDEKEPEAFATYAKEAYEERKNFAERAEEKPTPTELIPHRAKLRQFIKLSGRNSKVSVSFSTESLGDGVEYDIDRDELIIRDIPKSLRTRLLAIVREES